MLSFKKDRRCLKCNPCRYPGTGFVLRNPYLFQDLFCSILHHHSQLNLDPKQDWMPEAGPRRGHSILLYVTKKSARTSRDLFFHSMIHRQFLLGFICGASLLLCPALDEDVGHLMHFYYKGLGCCVIPRCAGHDSVVLLIGLIRLHLAGHVVLFLSRSLERTRNPGLRDNSNSSNTDVGRYLKLISASD